MRLSVRALSIFYAYHNSSHITHDLRTIPVTLQWMYLVFMLYKSKMTKNTPTHENESQINSRFTSLPITHWYTTGNCYQ